MAEGLAALRREIGAEPPAGLISALGDTELGRLAQLAAEAKQRQDAELQRAAEQALGHVPRLLRGAIQRVLR